MIDRVAMVTGAARGIGRATAHALARAGARAVVLVDVREDRLAETAALVRSAGSEALSCVADVASPSDLERTIAQTLDRFGALHVLHNNAGIGEGASDWPEVSAERVAAIVDVNLRAVVLGTRLALEPIERSGGGAIVHTASGAAFTPLPPQAVYASTKAGVVHFTRSCAPLAESHGVRVSCICPGLVATEMIAESGPDGPAPWLQSIVDQVEMLSPESIADAVLALIEDPESGGRVVEIHNDPAAR